MFDQPGHEVQPNGEAEVASHPRWLLVRDAENLARCPFWCGRSVKTFHKEHGEAEAVSVKNTNKIRGMFDVG